MKIKWLGHSCFLMTSESGTRVLTDPFDDTVGYKLPAVEADVVTTSHDHFDHNHTQIVKGNFEHLENPGTFSPHGICITGVSTYHDEAGGSKRGKNVIYKFDVDGVRVCHCGDLGHILTETQVQEIGEVDVLLLPVGGVFTVDAAGAVQVMEQLKPAVTIPMHYKTEALKFEVDGVDKFLAKAGKYKAAGEQEIELDKEKLSGLPPVLVMEYE